MYAHVFTTAHSFYRVEWILYIYMHTHSNMRAPQQQIRRRAILHLTSTCIQYIHTRYIHSGRSLSIPSFHAADSEENLSMLHVTFECTQNIHIQSIHSERSWSIKNFRTTQSEEGLSVVCDIHVYIHTGWIPSERSLSIIHMPTPPQQQIWRRSWAFCMWNPRVYTMHSLDVCIQREAFLSCANQRSRILGGVEHLTGVIHMYTHMHTHTHTSHMYTHTRIYTLNASIQKEAFLSIVCLPQIRRSVWEFCMWHSHVCTSDIHMYAL